MRFVEKVKSVNGGRETIGLTDPMSKFDLKVKLDSPTEARNKHQDKGSSLCSLNTLLLLQLLAPKKMCTSENERGCAHIQNGFMDL